MTIKELIKNLIKFYFKNGNCGLVRWKQYEGYVFIHNDLNDFLIKDSNTVLQVRNHIYQPTFCFSEHCECYVKDYIWTLIKMYMKFGNVNVVMFWNENSGSSPRNGILPITEVSLVNILGKNYCELS